MTGAAIAQRLPQRLDTLGALALAQSLSGALAFDRAIEIDASEVEAVGLVALQLLAAARAEAEGRGQSLRLNNVPPRMIDAIRTAGLGTCLLDDPQRLPEEAPFHLRFTEAALRFGGEPLDRLAALAAAGAAIQAILPSGRLREILADPDRLLICFSVTLPGPADEGTIADLIGVEDGGVLIEMPGAEPIPPVTLPLSSPPPPPEEIEVPVAQQQLEALVSLVGDLIASQAGLAEAIGPQRAALALPLADLDRSVAALQDGVLQMTTRRLDLLVEGLPGSGQMMLGGGGELELDRAMFARLAPVFGELAERPLTLAAAEEGGSLLLRLNPASLSDRVVQIVRALGGRVDSMGEGIELRLPRSRSLIEAIIVDVGQAAYALPVNAMIEVLRPADEMLHRLDPERIALRFRDRYVPIIAIGARFGLDGWERDPRRAVLVVVHAGRAMVAIQADAVADQRQIALKPLGGGLSAPPGIAGAAIIGAHRIALVLDPAAFEPAV